MYKIDSGGVVWVMMGYLRVFFCCVAVLGLAVVVWERYVRVGFLGIFFSFTYFTNQHEVETAALTVDHETSIVWHKRILGYDLYREFRHCTIYPPAKENVFGYEMVNSETRQKKNYSISCKGLLLPKQLNY